MIYLSSRTLPANNASSIQMYETAKALSNELKDRFFVIGKDVTGLNLGERGKSIGAKNLFRTGFLSAQFIKKNDIRIIYTREIRLLFVVMMILFFTKKTSLLRICFEYHLDFKNAVNKVVYFFLRRKITCHVFISNGLLKHLDKKYALIGKKIVAPDGIGDCSFEEDDLKRKEIRNLYFGNKQNRKVVIYSGSLFKHKWKGIDTLVDVANMPEMKNTVFVFLGAIREDRKILESMLQQENYMILDRIPYTNVLSYIHAADVAVVPSSGKYIASRLFTSPMKLFEYMNSGTPIVCSDVASNREIVDDSMAYFFEADDCQSCAQTILNALQNDVKRMEKAKNAKKHVQNFVWSKRAKKIVDAIYEK